MIRKIDSREISIDRANDVKVTQCGNIIEIRYMTSQPEPGIKKIDKDRYVCMATGELKEFIHTEARIDNFNSIKQSMKNLRDIINANTAEPQNVKFVTLTYRENMRDPQKLYKDVKNFHSRLRYRLQPDKFEFITAVEPQGRGAFHVHELLIFDKKAPFIPNNVLEKVWGHGFTKITNVKNVDNIGLYLTAYLCDVELSEATLDEIKRAKDIKEIEVTDENGQKTNKRLIKGARLKYYPKGFRFFRVSRGVKRPIITNCSYGEAENLVANASLIYEKAVEYYNEITDFSNKILYKTYNNKTKRI